MTPAEFKVWRKGLGFKQKEVADMLGLKKRVIQYYEKGKRDGKAVEIPKTVELACYAISNGVGGFDGVNAETLTRQLSEPVNVRQTPQPTAPAV